MKKSDFGTTDLSAAKKKKSKKRSQPRSLSHRSLTLDFKRGIRAL